MIVGCVRVSTAEQDPDHQIDVLLRAGVERENIHNTRDGLAAARARGHVGGRRPKLSGERAGRAQQLYDAGGKTVQQIADLFGVPRSTVSRSTVYGYLNRVPAGAPA